MTRQWSSQGFLCLLYPGLCPEEAHSLKTLRSEQKIKAPRKTLFLQPDDQEKGEAWKQQKAADDFLLQINTWGKTCGPPIHTFTKAIVKQRLPSFPFPTGWCERTLRESQSFHYKYSAVLQPYPHHYTLTSPAGAQRCVWPLPPGTNERPSAISSDWCFNRLPGKTGLYPLVEEKYMVPGVLSLQRLWIYNYLKKKKLKKEKTHLSNFENCCSKLFPTKYFRFSFSQKRRLTHRKIHSHLQLSEFC